jgi:hypothetical protein
VKSVRGSIFVLRAATTPTTTREALMSQTQLDEIAAELRRCADIDAIKALKARYCRLVDLQEWEAWGEQVFTEDCQLDTEAGVQNGRANVVAAISGSLKGARSVHRVSQPDIIITGANSASGVWAMHDIVALTWEGLPTVIDGYGYYHEDYVRTAAGWRIKRSKLIRPYIQTRRG